jgi:hypothetical protein
MGEQHKTESDAKFRLILGELVAPTFIEEEKRK